MKISHLSILDLTSFESAYHGVGSRLLLLNGEPQLKQLIHFHNVLVSVAATVVLVIELYKFIRFIIEH